MDLVRILKNARVHRLAIYTEWMQATAHERHTEKIRVTEDQEEELICDDYRSGGRFGVTGARQGRRKAGDRIF